MTNEEIEKEFEEIENRLKSYYAGESCISESKNKDIRFLLECHKRQEEKIEKLKEGIKQVIDMGFLTFEQLDKLKKLLEE